MRKLIIGVLAMVCYFSPLSAQHDQDKIDDAIQDIQIEIEDLFDSFGQFDLGSDIKLDTFFFKSFGNIDPQAPGGGAFDFNELEMLMQKVQDQFKNMPMDDLDSFQKLFEGMNLYDGTPPSKDGKDDIKQITKEKKSKRKTFDL